MFFFHHYCRCGEVVRQAFISDRLWREEDIILYSSGKSWYTQPGRIITIAHMVGELECGPIADGSFPTQEVTYKMVEAQEFKTVRYTFEREDHFNRKSGRYLFSNTTYRYKDGVTREKYQVRDDVPNIEGTRLVEAQR